MAKYRRPPLNQPYNHRSKCEARSPEIGGPSAMQRASAGGGPGPLGLQGPPRSLKISPVKIQDESGDPLSQSTYLWINSMIRRTRHTQWYKTRFNHCNQWPYPRISIVNRHTKSDGRPLTQLYKTFEWLRAVRPTQQQYSIGQNGSGWRKTTLEKNEKSALIVLLNEKLL